MSGVEELPRLTDWWREPWKGRFRSLARKLVDAGKDREEAARLAEKECRSEFFKEEMAKLSDRLKKPEKPKEEPPPFWTERYL